MSGSVLYIYIYIGRYRYKLLNVLSCWFTIVMSIMAIMFIVDITNRLYSKLVKVIVVAFPFIGKSHEQLDFPV